jgi:hypothetical protein
MYNTGSNSMNVLNGQSHLDLEFKLHKIVDFIKKQGYSIENSFVSYYSSDF